MLVRIVWVVFTLLFLSIPFRLLGQSTACVDAIDQFRKDQSALDSASEDCQKELGYRMVRFVDDCFAVEKAFFITLVGKMEANRGLVCGACQGEWPERELGSGNCSNSPK